MVKVTADDCRIKFLSLILSVAALQICLLPVYGPFLNSQFAGWQPNHNHLYLSPRGLNHLHPYDAPRAYLVYPAQPAVANTWLDEPSSRDVIFLPSHDVSTQTIPFLEMPFVQVFGNSFHPGNNAAQLGGMNEEMLPAKEIFLPLPEKPPRF